MLLPRECAAIEALIKKVNISQEKAKAGCFNAKPFEKKTTSEYYKSPLTNDALEPR